MNHIPNFGYNGYVPVVASKKTNIGWLILLVIACIGGIYFYFNRQRKVAAGKKKKEANGNFLSNFESTVQRPDEIGDEFNSFWNKMKD